MAKSKVTPAVDASKRDDWREGLTLSEQAFVEEFLVDLNGTAAVRRMGKNVKRPDQAALDYRKRPKVKAAIEKLFASRGVTKLRMVEEAAKAAFSDITDYVRIVPILDDNGKPIPGKVMVEVKSTDELTPEQLGAIASISETRNEFGTVITVKPHDKFTAMQFMAKIMGQFTDKVEHTGKDGGPIQTQELSDAKARLAQMLGIDPAKLGQGAEAPKPE